MNEYDHWYSEIYRQMSHQQQTSKIAAQIKKDPIEEATDDKLILELIKRGYAVYRPTDDFTNQKED